MQPQPFGMYTLINRINVGGMAEVFKACYYDERRPAFAAIKRILPHLAQDRAFINMFIREARTAGRLKHPNIAQIIEQSEEEGEYFISMEYISGRDLLYLRYHLRERGVYFPPALAAHVVAQVASALDYAHRCCDEAGQHLALIHRDISPQNILISYNGEVKLIDFGIAKAKSGTQEHTRAGVLKGKFGYMAPEQVKSKSFDHRVDIFALGTVFYELLTNERLFMGESDIETLEMVRQAHVTPPSHLNRFIPPRLDQIIMRALTAEPTHRYQTAGELAHDLQEFIRNEAPITHHATLRTWMQQEFSTFIAHEKAQDSYLLDQMRENLEDSESEDLDSTSLISADVIDQLHAYAQAQLNGVAPQHEHETPTDPSIVHESSGGQGIEEVDTPISTNNLRSATEPMELDHRDFDLTVPISPAELAQVELRIDAELNPMQYGDHSVSDMNYESFDISEALPSSTQQGEYRARHDTHIPSHTSQLDHIEGLLDEPLESSVGMNSGSLDGLDELDDEDSSGLFKVDNSLDQILSMSMTQGSPSPLASSPQGLSSVLNSDFQSASAAPYVPSLTHGAPSPLASPTSNQPVRLGLGQGFSADEPTPPPQPIRASLKRAPRRSKFGVWIGVIALLASGAAAAMFLLTPSVARLKFEVTPTEEVKIRLNFDTPILASEVTELEVPSDPSLTKVTIRHPYLPQWSEFLTSDNLKRGLLTVNLEENAPKIKVSIKSNVNGAQVWVLGILRGTTPFQGFLPANRRGELKVKVTYQDQPPKESIITRKRKGFFARF